MTDPINPREEEIKKQLIKNGVFEGDIQFRGEENNRYIRISYWRELTEEQLKDTQLVEDLYEDDDGDDYRGRPIIIRKYSYYIK
jgi:hypothetical protein